MGRSLRAAGKAFVWWQLPVLAMAVAMYAAAPLLAAAHAADLAALPGLPEEDWFLGHLRRIALEQGGVIIVLLGAYWLLSGLASVAFLKVRAADILLFSGLLCLLPVWANAYLGLINTYCDVLPFPHQGFRLDRFYECPTSMTLQGLLGIMGLGLGLVSLLVRLVVGRLADRPIGPA